MGCACWYLLRVICIVLHTIRNGSLAETVIIIAIKRYNFVMLLS